MKQCIITFSLLLGMAISGFSQPPAWNDPSQKKLDESEIKAPNMTWVKDSYDFGSIPQGVPVHVTFEFTNTGNAPLIITKVEPACNCTAADYPKQPIMPGQKGSIKITFDAASTGKFSKTAIVTSNAKPTDKMLVFTGTVVKKK
ncbi:MAG TPA: DUF1573 domain-containing protein [Bacteroidales bacterium]|nr:DUF1573 domain-containing protein [Bacteroidales bacterium]